MQSIIEMMQNSLSLAGGNVGVTALFIAGLIALWHVKFADNQEAGVLFWYALTTLIVIVFPLYTLGVERYIPELMWDNMYLWILPVVPVVLYAGVLASSRLRHKSKKILFGIGMIGLVFLASASSYRPDAVKFMDRHGFIPDADEAVLARIEDYRASLGKNQVLIWADDKFMINARLYSGNIHTIYGKEMWLGYEETGLNVGYEDWVYEAFRLMKQPRYNLDSIGELAKENGIDAIVIMIGLLGEDEMVYPDLIGDSYYLDYETDNYLMYVVASN